MNLKEFIKLCKERGLCAVEDNKHFCIKIPTSYGQEGLDYEFVSRMDMDLFNRWINRVIQTHEVKL